MNGETGRARYGGAEPKRGKETEFYGDGRPAAETAFGPDGKPRRRSEYGHDGKITAETKFGPDGKPAFRWEYSYDGDGNLASWSEYGYDSEGNAGRRTDCAFDGDDAVSVTERGADGSVASRSRLERRADGNFTETGYDPEGNETYRAEYDGDWNLLSRSERGNA